MKKLLLILNLIFFTNFIDSIKANTLIVNNLLNSGVGSLRTAITSSIAGDTIRFNPLLISSGNDTLKLSSQLTIPHSLTIKGLFNINDTIYISGNNLNIIFKVNAGNLHLDSLSLINGNGLNGSAVNFLGDTLFLNNCYIGYNKTDYGGAIYVASNLIAENVLFEKDSAVTSGNGGAITAESAEYLYINNCIFRNCYADGAGGAIYAVSTNITIKNSLLTQNYCEKPGGAICVNGTFNTGIDTNTYDCIIDSCDITYNWASGSNTGGAISGGGGGIYCGKNMIFNITNSRLIGNGTNYDGGAIGNYYLSSLNFPSLITIMNCILDSNIARMGGAIDMSVIGDSCILIINSCQLNNNTSSLNGGAISFSPDNNFLPNSKIYISNSTFKNNNGKEGGAINAIAQMFFDSLFLENNIATNGSGGAFSVYTASGLAGSSFNLVNSKIIGNQSTNLGGGINLYSDDSNAPMSANISNTIFENNSSVNLGGGISISHSYISSPINAILDNCKFTANTSKSGAALGVSNFNPSSILIINSSFVNNLGDVATGNGGACDLQAPNATIRNCTFFNNSGRIGGGIYHHGGSFLLESCTFTGNHAYNGGAIYADYHLTTKNLTIIGNTADNYGGGVYLPYLSSPTMNVGNTIIVGNMSSVGNRNLKSSYPINSLGYNLFGDTTIVGVITSDSMMVDSIDLALTPLRFNGGVTKTRMPTQSSICVNQGNPTDFSDAQNISITDSRRDIGAAEYTCNSYSILDIVTCESVITSPSGIFTWTSSGTYVDTILNATGCDSIMEINLTINLGILSNYTYFNNTNGNYSFTNTSTGNFNQTHWAFGDGTTSTATNPNHTFSANGTYVVVLTVNDSIGSSCMDYYLDTIVVTGVVAPLQCAAGFVMYPDAGGVTVVNSSTGTNLTYLWNFGDGNTSNLQFPTHTYAASGPYYLCLTIDDGAGCVDMYCDSIGENGVVFNKQTGFTINVIAPPLATQVSEQAAIISAMSVYPNPTGKKLNVVFNKSEPYQLKIVTIDGKLIETKTIVGNTTLDVSSYSSGMYFITATNNEGKVYQSKFVKE